LSFSTPPSVNAFFASAIAVSTSAAVAPAFSRLSLSVSPSEGQAIQTVACFDLVALGLIIGRVRFGIAHHLVDLIFGKTDDE